MKKTLAVIAIILCVLETSIVFATDTEDALNNLPTTQQTIDKLFGVSDEEVEDNEMENSSKKKGSENANVTEEKKDESATSNIADEIKKEKKTFNDYQDSYGSESYGLTAYVLSKIQIYSIPFCFLGIAISAIYQYVLGIRKLDTRDKGFAIMISIITVFVIAQVLPLIFAIVVKGWRR